jgi:hypothetical protein
VPKRRNGKEGKAKCRILRDYQAVRGRDFACRPGSDEARYLVQWYKCRPRKLLDACEGLGHRRRSSRRTGRS